MRNTRLIRLIAEYRRSKTNARKALDSEDVRGSQLSMHFSSSSKPSARVFQTRRASFEIGCVGENSSSRACDHFMRSRCFAERTCLRLKGLLPRQRLHSPNHHVRSCDAFMILVSVCFLFPGTQKLQTMPKPHRRMSCWFSNMAERDMCDGCGIVDLFWSSGAIGCNQGADQTSSARNA